MRAQRLTQVRELAQVQLQKLSVVRVQGRKPARQQELAAVLKRVREPRVSRQLEQQQHRLQAAAQELPPYLPALPMKALC